MTKIEFDAHMKDGSLEKALLVLGADIYGTIEEMSVLRRETSKTKRL